MSHATDIYRTKRDTRIQQGPSEWRILISQKGKDRFKLILMSDQTSISIANLPGPIANIDDLAQDIINTTEDHR